MARCANGAARQRRLNRGRRAGTRVRGGSNAGWLSARHQQPVVYANVSYKRYVKRPVSRYVRVVRPCTQSSVNRVTRSSQRRP